MFLHCFKFLQCITDIDALRTRGTGKLHLSVESGISTAERPLVVR